MALFNRKKGDAPAPSTSAPLPTSMPKTPDDAFDFDAISRDLDAQGGASSFDSLLSAPAAPTAPTGTPGSNSAFDFPETDPLGLTAPSTTPPASSGFGRAGAVPVPDAPAPELVASPPIGMAPLDTPHFEEPSVRPKAKKSLPLFPILGALGLLAVAAGGAMFMTNSNKDADSAADTPEPLLKPGKGKVGKSAVPPTGATAPRNLVAKAPPAAQAATPAATLRSASPGIAPPTAPKIPVGSGTSKVPVRIAQNPEAPSKAKLPSATAGLDPLLATKLKAFWEAGATAKHNKDFAGARKAWQEALRLDPNHPGFQASIDQLPR